MISAWWIIPAVLVGAFFGVLIMALVWAGKDELEEMERALEAVER